MLGNLTEALQFSRGLGFRLAALLSVAILPIGLILTGLFLHDGGAFGIKSRATLRVIQRPRHTGHASFAFAALDDAVRALCAIQRKGLVEDAYIMDPGATDHLDIDPATAHSTLLVAM